MQHEDYLALCEEIRKHNQLYYDKHQPIISDEEYDKLYKKLEKAEQEHPEWSNPDSPTRQVEESLTAGFKTVKHRIPMLSLANTYSKDELMEFIKRIHKLVERKDIAFSCELKMDGIAVSVLYENGKFARGVTRGDGRQGDDISANIKTIASLPHVLKGEHIPARLELRGEVFMTHAQFKLLNDERAIAEEPLWANPRNAAAGSLKLLDNSEVKKRGLSIVFYGIAESSEYAPKFQHEVHEKLKKFGLPTLQELALAHNIEEIWEFAEKIRLLRPEFSYDIDGIVIKLDNIADQERLGVTGKNPRWAVAYKFAAEQAITRILDITVQVGRTGILTPVAELEPTFLAGSTISRATLHNEEEIQRKDIRIGDSVLIEKGGDVIPKVVEVIFDQRSKHSTPWQMPTHCPSCGSQLVKIASEVAVRCPNHTGCPEQVLRYLIYFASKQAYDIENLGEKVMGQLVSKGFVKECSDIFKLSSHELFQLEGFKQKSVDNLLKSIEQAKNVALPRFIMGLGIKHVGIGTAELLAAKAGSIEALRNITADQLLSIDGIGDKVSEAVIEYFSEPSHQKLIDQLLSLGVTPQQTEVIHHHGHAFDGKSFVLTGSLDAYTRQSAASLIKERGGKVVAAVTKKTDFVVVGHDPGSKFEKAQELGIRILSEQEFSNMLY